MKVYNVKIYIHKETMKVGTYDSFTYTDNERLNRNHVLDGTAVEVVPSENGEHWIEVERG